jgi:hypothetical protein
MWRNRFMQPSRMDTFAMYLTNEYWGRKDEDGELIEFTDQLFVDELLKKFEKTPEMKAGTALHKILELSQYQEELHSIIGIDGEMYQFEYCIDESINIVLPILREKKINKQFNDIIVNGVVDAINATTIWDHKFTKQIRYEKYANSYQWRIYLWMEGLNTFKYNIFQGKVLPSTIEPVMNNIRIDKFEAFDFERYAGMDREIEDLYTYYWEILNKLKPLIIETAHINNIILKGELS